MLRLNRMLYALVGTKDGLQMLHKINGTIPK